MEAPTLEFLEILESSSIMVSSLSDIDSFLLIVNKVLSPTRSVHFFRNNPVPTVRRKTGVRMVGRGARLIGRSGILATHWQHIGNTLATHSNTLATHWQHIGNTLAAH